MKHLMNFFKGIAIGITNVIPGFSGGTMAVMLNIYDLFVYAFANIFNDFKNVVKKCWSLFIGIVFGILLAMLTIVRLLEIIPFITIMFFVGLTFGSMPQIYKRTRGKNIKFVDVIGFIIAIAIIIILPLIQTTNNTDITYHFGLYVIMLLLGIVCSSAMVIPGVSGSLVLMAFGYYAFFMTTLKDFLKNIFHFSMTNYWNMLAVIACFAIGCILGLVFVSKLITKLMKKYPQTIYWIILGLLVASPFSIIYATIKDYSVTFDLLNIIFSIISLILGVTFVLIGDYFSKKKEYKNQNESSSIDDEKMIQ